MKYSISVVPDAEAGRRPPWRAGLLVMAIVALALCVRLFYVFDTHIANPIQGDINQYVLYAWNLVHSGTFSSSLPNAGPIRADSYRGPGYSLVLAGMMELTGNANLYLTDAGENGRRALLADPHGWMTGMYILQALLGAASAWLTIALARLWLSRRSALLAGLIVALWPHLIAFTNVLLSETLFGFLLLLALWLTAYARRRSSVSMAVGAGLAFAAAYLVNPVIGLFPLLTAGLLWRVGRFLSLAFMLAYSVAPVAWGIRNHALPADAGSATERAAQNFVQGSWPQFLIAYNSRMDNFISARIVSAEEDEERTFVLSPAQGLAMMRERMEMDPGFYLAWYLFRKPWALWAWDIRIGAGGIYFLPVTHSAFDHVTVLKAIAKIYVLANPLIFAFAFLGALAVGCGRSAQHDEAHFVAGLTALLATYLTLVHVILQAEPRYSIPYRPFEVLLALSGAVAFGGLWAKLVHRYRPASGANA